MITTARWYSIQMALLLASSAIQFKYKTFCKKNVLSLTKYFTSLKLKMNPLKTEFIIFRRNRIFKVSESIEVGNKIIRESEMRQVFSCTY